MKSKRRPTHKRPAVLAPDMTQEAWERMVQSDYAYGILKLLGQLDILRDRVESALIGFRPDTTQRIYDTLILDLETFYTVAHDLLKLVELLLPPEAQARFRCEEGFKTICGVRSHLVRHAYDKPGGDPSGNVAFSPTNGPRLKGGSVVESFKDPGFVPNAAALSALAKKYDFRGLMSANAISVGVECRGAKPT